MSFRHEFKVANPSSYPRDDYVEVDMETLCVPASLMNEKSLKLSRVTKEGPEEIPFQIDSVLGEEAPKRVLTFISMATPPGVENYTGPETETFVLEEGTPKDYLSARTRDDLWIVHYYDKPEPGEPADGCNRAWFPERKRKVYGVKLISKALEVYFSLVPHPRLPIATNLAGAATSVVHCRARDWTGTVGEILSPWAPRDERARWGQLTHLAFYPLPWEGRWFDKKSLLRAEGEYELVWSHTGPIRSVVTLRSEPLTIRYEGKPYFSPETADVTCHIYRVISSYPGKEYYVEQLYVRTEHGLMLAFRPYFTSYLSYGPRVAVELSRFEDVPDFFAVWRHFGPMHYGYGFASDAHVRDVALNGDEISWRLQLGHDCKCLHYFMLNSEYKSPPLDPRKEIGHYGWYEQIFKPIRALPIVPDLPHNDE